MRAKPNAGGFSGTKPGTRSTRPTVCTSASAIAFYSAIPPQPYPTAYKPRPESRDYVINLTNWYAQAHPVEDFAETFAIWLNPHVDWRNDYKRWPALEKLTYVDELMREIAGRRPPVSRQERSGASERAAAYPRRALRRKAQIFRLELAGQLRPGLAPHLLG